MSRDKLQTVLEHKGRSIRLNTSTGKFSVEGFENEELESLAAAKKAVDRATKALLDVKRRPVIVSTGRPRYYDDDSGEWIFGELTSFSAHHWSRGNLHANVVKSKERAEYDPDDVYEDTASNREWVKRVTEIEKQIFVLVREREQLLTETMVRVEVPDLKLKGDES